MAGISKRAKRQQIWAAIQARQQGEQQMVRFWYALDGELRSELVRAELQYSYRDELRAKGATNISSKPMKTDHYLVTVKTGIRVFGPATAIECKEEQQRRARNRNPTETKISRFPKKSE